MLLLPHFCFLGSSSPHRTSHGAFCPSLLPPHPLSPRVTKQSSHAVPTASPLLKACSPPLPFFHSWTQPVFCFISCSSSSHPRVGCVNTGSTVHSTETLGSYLTTLSFLTTFFWNHWTVSVKHVTGFFLPCHWGA